MIRKSTLFLLRTPSEAYKFLVSKGEMTFDEHQSRMLPVFDRLYNDLTTYLNDAKVTPPPPRQLELRPPNRLGIIPSFFMRRLQEKKVSRAVASISPESDRNAFHPLSNVKGLYVWGGVGCGKTTLMDLLYENAPPQLKKHRIHFHQFMLDVHKTSHSIKFFSEEEKEKIRRATGYKHTGNRRSPDAEINMFDEIAQRISGNVELLCFDEVAVTDVADAMILKRLFTAFYRIGIVVIFTSNRPPKSLYLNGLNREAFLPFIELIEKMNVVQHMPSNKDHRLSRVRSNVYFSPFGPDQELAFNQLYLECSKGLPSKPKVLKVFGRDVCINQACGQVCYFHFSDICGSCNSTADYQVIAQNFHTIFINGVPQFSYQPSDVKNRFLVLIDTLYEYHCKVVIYAAVIPELIEEPKENKSIGDSESSRRFDDLTLLEKAEGKAIIDESDSSFQMQRCVSRLIEMQSSKYLERPHKEKIDQLPTEN